MNIQLRFRHFSNIKKQYTLQVKSLRGIRKHMKAHGWVEAYNVGGVMSFSVWRKGKTVLSINNLDKE